jgi:hypothetical protein
MFTKNGIIAEELGPEKDYLIIIKTAPGMRSLLLSSWWVVQETSKIM